MLLLLPDPLLVRLLHQQHSGVLQLVPMKASHLLRMHEKLGVMTPVRE